MRTATPPPATPAGALTTADTATTGSAAELVGSFLAEVLGVPAPVAVAVGARGTLELVAACDSVGLPPPGERPPGVQPAGGRGEQAMAEDVTGGVTCGVLC